MGTLFIVVPPERSQLQVGICEVMEHLDVKAFRSKARKETLGMALLSEGQTKTTKDVINKRFDNPTYSSTSALADFNSYPAQTMSSREPAIAVHCTALAVQPAFAKATIANEKIRQLIVSNTLAIHMPPVIPYLLRIM